MDWRTDTDALCGSIRLFVAGSGVLYNHKYGGTAQHTFGYLRGISDRRSKPGSAGLADYDSDDEEYHRD